MRGGGGVGGEPGIREMGRTYVGSEDEDNRQVTLGRRGCAGRHALRELGFA